MTVPALKPLNVPAPTADEPNKRLKIGAKLRVAIDAIVFDGLDLAAAAAKAKCSTRAVYKALERAHVLSYLKRRREVLRAAARGQNIRRLVQIRDAADNMPAVNAIKALEQMDDQAQLEGSARRSPGLVIVIQGNAQVSPADGAKIVDHASISGSEDD